MREIGCSALGPGAEHSEGKSHCYETDYLAIIRRSLCQYCDNNQLPCKRLLFSQL